MNYASLALALVFAAVGVFFQRWPSSAEPVMVRNKRLASTLFFVASAGFLVAFTISVFNDGTAAQ